MGNNHSQMSGLQVQEKAVEVTDFWSHHSATVSSGNSSTVSVFIGEPLVEGSLWVSQTPLEKESKNLMIHRHPCILKYISSWNRNSKYYLIVEDVKPLAHVLAKQSNLQICIGLHSILKALAFLHDKARASHNNVCTASVYVTRDGSWKLGGLEYLCKFSDMSAEFLNRSKVHRYNKAIDPNEHKHAQTVKGSFDFVDIYAFAVLVQEIFKKVTDDSIPFLTDLMALCGDELQNGDALLRPKLDTLLEHQFFSHEFIEIHSFLTELPLKSDDQKIQFFSNLIEKLRDFDEETVANQLGGLLLSRMVLLNKAAQNDVIPILLNLKEDANNINALFTLPTFKKFIVPKLLEIFCVRDAQIRLILLEYFNNFTSCFTKEELQSHILPELLVGIKDTNDHLVSVTLRALADLIPMLGATTVIGGKRAKLFNDGRPIMHVGKPRSRRNSRRPQDLMNLPLESDVLSNGSEAELPERPSPDGEEGETSTEEIEVTAEELGGEEENWDDWDLNEEVSAPLHEEVTVTDAVVMTNTVDSAVGSLQKKNLPDILELDIKNQRNLNNKSEDIDFFQDMEPVIETSSKFIVDESVGILNLGVSNIEHLEEGWDDDLDWEV